MIKVCVLGIEPIEPAFGGSRLRLKGLYSNLGNNFDVTYVGAFHWRGQTNREIQHQENFREITISFSDIHFEALNSLHESSPGPSLIDESFPRLGYQSTDLCITAIRTLQQSDVVIFSHPWMYAVAKHAVNISHQLLVYDAHNIEGKLRKMLLGESAIDAELLQEVESVERELCAAADLILACSNEDMAGFVDMYDVEPEKINLCPNGAFINEISTISRTSRTADFYGSFPDSPMTALFIGGQYIPNIEAVEFICREIAPECPHITFGLLGDSGPAFIRKNPSEKLPFNVNVIGGVDDGQKLHWLHASDIAINPMFSGSGTNIKMFDYLSAGLPVVSSAVGARGIQNDGEFIISDIENFIDSVKSLAADANYREVLSRRGRTLVEKHYDWGNISEGLGVLLSKSCKPAQKMNNPENPGELLFSVTIPTLNRHEKLRRLLDLLTNQHEKNFEVIIVDQSEVPFTNPNIGLDITLIHTTIKGACRARNLAAEASRGKFIVFIDDDCEPGEQWLLEAGKVLQTMDVVGLEGRIFSDRTNDPDWRSVHNYGSESIGYMTGNMFVRAKDFHSINGFDVRFDEVNFRYDTDFGWRLKQRGDIPFSEHAFVYHPPWSRKIWRESEAEKNKMFAGDALLMEKHPGYYQQLFLKERHWHKTSFWPPFVNGLKKRSMELPDYAKRKYLSSTLSSEYLGVVPQESSNKVFAYVFYATSDSYGLAVIVACLRLMQFSRRGDVDFLVLLHDVSSEIIKTMEKIGMKIVICAPLNKVYEEWYQGCLTKLRAFQLGQYRRVIYLDADTLPLKDLDHLFDLPNEVDIAAPNAYWLDGPWVTSFLMVIKPSQKLWSRVENHFQAAYENKYYDMDIINHEFSAEILVMEDIYGCLNSEWADTNKEYHFGDPEASILKIPIVHFSAVGKPWYFNIEEIREALPNAHPIFFNIWRVWRREYINLEKNISRGL